VATSGNLADEPICTDEREAVQRLGGMVDAFLVHDRPIARHADDSIARVVLGRELLLRRARGYAPLPIVVEGNALSVLGVGPHLKNTVALSVGRNVFVSQHVGDLETAQAHSAFERVVRDFGRLYDTSPGLVASDAHPDYLSSGFAASLPLPRVQVQHHVAHVAACMAENEIGPPVLGVAWDGTGFGLDGDMWGGECFVAGSDGIRRFAALRSFALPGGDVAAREPRRSALGLLEEWRRAAGLPALALDDAALRHLAAAFDERELPLVLRMLERRVNSPRTTSVGRLFDAVSSLVGLRQRARYEGQAAMELEYASADNARHAPGYPMPVEPAPQAGGDPAWSLNWGPMLEDLLVDLRAGCPAGTIGARFHRALADAVVSVARLAGQPRVVLSGGCFQSRLLTELVVGRLRDAGFRPYWHQRIPPNDGGISLGQVAAAAWGWGIEQQAAGSTQQADSQ
jgi:hydrogenase maturation protein HypF